MKLWDEYYLPDSIEGALQIYHESGADSALIAGGTDLLIDLQGEDVDQRPRILIDVTAIPELQGVQVDGDRVRLGAAATHAEVISHEEMRRMATVLVEGCQVIGGPQVRNVATVGGNVAHALPAADSTLGLVALGAEAQIATRNEDGSISVRWVGMPDLFAGPGQNTLIPHRELIVAFRFQGLTGKSASAFRRIMRPQGIALPIMGLACTLVLDESGSEVKKARIVPGPIAPVPTRAVKTEDALVGEKADRETFRKAVEIARQECQPRTSKYRATSEYRNMMISQLLQEALTAATKRARTGEIVIEQPFIGEHGVRPTV